jgi:2,4-dienoyl-CoA reductase-like NADH-dependent reductase (Old Yellow Enzyme family)
LPYGPSKIHPLENTYTPSGFLDTETPQAHTTVSIQQTIEEFRQLPKPAAFNKGLIQPDENTIADYTYILDKLNGYELAYVQLVGPAIDLTGTPIAELQGNYFEYFRTVYHGTLMVNLGFTGETANEILISGTAAR